MKSNYIIKYWDKLILIALLVIVLSSFNTKNENSEPLNVKGVVGPYVAMPVRNDNSGTASFAIFDTESGECKYLTEISPDKERIIVIYHDMWNR